MARPVAADAEATRARILAASIDLVAERGIDGTTVRDVAAASSVSLATVLHYFESKDGLYRAVVAAMDAELAGLRDQLLSSLQPGVSVSSSLEQMVRHAWAFACAHRAAHKVILRTVLADGGLPADRIDTVLRPALDEAGGILALVFGVSVVRARLTMQTVVALSARYAIASELERCVVTNAATLDEADAAIADHLVDVTLGLLLPRAGA